MRATGTDRTPGRSGFTIVELAIVLTIASILIGFAMPRLTDVFQQRDVNGVRDGVILLAAQARARAMEEAETIQFHLDSGNGIAFIVDSGDTVDVLRFRDEFGVEASVDPAHITLCYTSRGFATQPCSTALTGPTDATFSRSSYTAMMEIWQLGQLRKR